MTPLVEAAFDALDDHEQESIRLGLEQLADLAEGERSQIVKHAITYLDPAQLFPDIHGFSEKAGVDIRQTFASMVALSFLMRVLFVLSDTRSATSFTDDAKRKGLLSDESEAQLQHIIKDHILPLAQSVNDVFAKGASISSTLPLCPSFRSAIDMRVAMTDDDRHLMTPVAVIRLSGEGLSDSVFQVTRRDVKQLMEELNELDERLASLARSTNA